MRKLILLWFALVSLNIMALENIEVMNLTAQQRYPWNGLVDISVTIQGTKADIADTEFLFVATNTAKKTAIPVAHISRNGDDVGSGSAWTRKFIWDAKADAGAVKIEDVALTVDTSLGVQLWKNGPYWAECNVGAMKPEEFGYYFWWGDTVGYMYDGSQMNAVDGSRKGFNFNNLSSIDYNCPTYDKSNSTLKSKGYIDATGNLVAKYDAATKHWGAPWRMPTSAEIDALLSHCDMEWTTRNGIAGRLVKGRGAYASKSIFLPAAGYGYGSHLLDLSSYGGYWSSTPNSDNLRNAWFLYFGSGGSDQTSYNRGGGQSVRPLRDFAQ